MSTISRQIAEREAAEKAKAKAKKQQLRKPLPLNNHVSTIKTTRIN